MYEASVYSVMIAAPGDVIEERAVIHRVLAEWNAMHSRDRRAALMPLHWSTHSRPALGARGQEIINRQVTDQSDVLIAVFKGKLGSPTGEFVSGTVEEIQEHIKAGKPVLIYFSNVPVPPDSIVPAERQRLSDFRAWLEAGNGLYNTYNSVEEFEANLRNHLTAQVQDLLGSRVPPGTPRAEAPSLGAEARELLLETAADPHGVVMVSHTFGGTQVQANGREFAEQGNRRSESRWLGGLDELYDRRYVEGDRRGVGQLSVAGYRAADELLPEEAPPSPAASPDVRVLKWYGGRGPYGAGLAVHNIGKDVALNLEGQRLTPSGGFDVSRSLKSLEPSERGSFANGWQQGPVPDDAPKDPAPDGKYLTRIMWEDRAGKRHVGEWTVTDKDQS